LRNPQPPFGDSDGLRPEAPNDFIDDSQPVQIGAGQF